MNKGRQALPLTVIFGDNLRPDVGTKAIHHDFGPDNVNPPTGRDGATPLEKVEKTTILNTLEASGGNKSETARRLGITRKTLHKKLKAYGVMK